MFDRLQRRKKPRPCQKPAIWFFSSEKNEDIKLVINNTEIEKVRSCKHLGIYIDDELNWNVHIDHIFNKLLKFTGIIYKLTAKLSYDRLKSIYFAFVYPHVLYGIEIYANTYISYNIDKLIKPNHKILTIIQNQPFLLSLTHTPV